MAPKGERGAARAKIGAKLKLDGQELTEEKFQSGETQRPRSSVIGQMA